MVHCLPVPLIHIGYHKTGTSWLQKLVFNNQDIGFISPIIYRDIVDTLVIPNALDFDHHTCRDTFNQAVNVAHNLNLTPVFSAERLSGHPHSGGYDAKMIADRLVQIFPRAKVLIVIREQRNIILSCYMQYISRGGAITLPSYLKAPYMRMIPLFNLDHFKYHRLISYYHKLYNQDNVLVLPYELFNNNPKLYVSRILRFCNLPNAEDFWHQQPEKMVINKSLSGFEAQFRLYTNFLFGTRYNLNQHSLFPLSWEKTNLIFKVIRKINEYIPQSYNQRILRRMSGKVAEVAGDTYKLSNLYTSELINLDLSQYGYMTP